MILGSVATIGSFEGQGSMVLGSVLLPLGLCRTGFDSFHGGLEHFPHTVVKHAGCTTTPKSNKKKVFLCKFFKKQIV